MLSAWGFGGTSQEHAVSARERLGDDVDVVVRSLHDLDALARLRGKPGGIAHDHADGLSAVEDVVEDLVADLAGGSGDDDHGNLRGNEEAEPRPPKTPVTLADRQLY